MADGPIPGFTRHRGLYRQHVTLPREVALDVAAEAEARGTTVAAVLRERVIRGGGKAYGDAMSIQTGPPPDGPPLREWVTAEGVRVAVYEWRPETAEGQKE